MKWADVLLNNLKAMLIHIVLIMLSSGYFLDEYNVKSSTIIEILLLAIFMVIYFWGGRKYLERNTGRTFTLLSFVLFVFLLFIYGPIAEKIMLPMYLGLGYLPFYLVPHWFIYLANVSSLRLQIYIYGLAAVIQAILMCLGMLSQSENQDNENTCEVAL